MTQWLLDTGPLVAFFDRTDQYHDWAVRQWVRAPIPMLTCEPVIAEALYLLAQTYRKLGREPEAAQMLARFQEASKTRPPRR